MRPNGSKPSFRAFFSLVFALSLLLVSLLFLGSSTSRGAHLAVAPVSLDLFSPEIAPQDTGRPRAASGQLSRRARALQQKVSRPDTTRAEQRVATLLDSIRALPRDSSARLAQFHHVRRDQPQADPVPPKTHAMYLPDPAPLRVQHVLDSLQWVYKVRRTVLGNDVRVPLVLPLEDYTRLRLSSAIRKNWETLAHSYKLQQEKKQGLGELFGQVTSVEIPVPKNPLFSIFGPNRIRLLINGSVDIHAGFRNTKSDVFTANPLGQERNEPDFGQEVQVNVKGEIGDKLKIDADWNTGRQFEYENQVKVRYAGYEDDIVQS
ncbi:MAG: hypothetical protein ACRDGA_11635, partial [Bacteroidota bacterium]